MLSSILAILALITMASCGGSSENDEQTNEVDEAWIKDSLDLVQRTTPDLLLFEVHGPVKQISISYKYGKEWGTPTAYEFDQDGQFIKYDGYDPFTGKGYEGEDMFMITYSRDQQGKISEMQGYENACKYLWKENNFIGCESSCEGNGVRDTYTYDDNGFIVEVESKEFDIFTNEVYSKSSVKYTYPEIDQYGNWTLRKGGDCDVKREIVYYPIEKK